MIESRGIWQYIPRGLIDYFIRRAAFLGRFLLEFDLERMLEVPVPCEVFRQVFHAFHQDFSSLPRKIEHVLRRHLEGAGFLFSGILVTAGSF